MNGPNKSLPTKDIIFVWAINMSFMYIVVCVWGGGSRPSEGQVEELNSQIT